jgi:hypothetical protein
MGDGPHIDIHTSGETGVYALVHIATGRAYVGASARCIGNRFSWHLAVFRRNAHTSKAAQELWNKSQPSDWHFKIVERCASDRVRERESFWFTQFDLLNTIPDAHGRGPRHNEETKAKMRAGRARYLETPGAREALSERAKKQHAEKNFGAHTWTDGPDYETIASNWSRSEENVERLKKHVAAQSSEEMSRRSLLRRNIRRVE